MEQIEKLANFIMSEVEGEPSLSEGAGDTAIRIIRKLQSTKVDTGQSSKLTASEAVYGFCGWLTTRKEQTIMSAKDNCVLICDLIKQFCEENKLGKPRDGWNNNLIHPKGECSGLATIGRTEKIQELGKMLTATTIEDQSRLKSIIDSLSDMYNSRYAPQKIDFSED